MKMKFLAVAALCGLGMTSCTNDLIENAHAPVGSPVKITLQADQDTPQTRADYTEDANDHTLMHFSWQKGDALSLVVPGSDTDKNIQLATTEAGPSASFTGTVTAFTGTKTIYAFYSYKTKGYTINNSDNPEIATADLTLPVEQPHDIGKAVVSSFLVGSGSATAPTSGASNVQAKASLKQVMSIIKLNITNAPSKVSLVTLTCSEALFPTTATVKIKDGTITNPGNFVKALSLKANDETSGTTKAVSFAVFPTDGLDGKEISIRVDFTGNDGDGNYDTKTITKTGVKFARNMHYTLDFDAAAEFTVGDFYLNDGTILDKETELTPEQKAACIGIVCLVGRDVATGKIISLDEKPNTQWSTENVTTSANSSSQGAENTKKVLAFGSYTATTYPAFAWCAAKNNPTTLGIEWYLPSPKELKDIIYANKTILNASLNKVNATPLSDGTYWSSQERSDNMAEYVSLSTGKGTTTKKTTTSSFRAVSAF